MCCILVISFLSSSCALGKILLLFSKLCTAFWRLTVSVHLNSLWQLGMSLTANFFSKILSWICQREKMRTPTVYILLIPVSTALKRVCLSKQVMMSQKWDSRFFRILQVISILMTGVRWAETLGEFRAEEGHCLTDALKESHWLLSSE